MVAPVILLKKKKKKKERRKTPKAKSDRINNFKKDNPIA
jgi:hypothetical protein